MRARVRRNLFIKLLTKEVSAASHQGCVPDLLHRQTKRNATIADRSVITHRDDSYLTLFYDLYNSNVYTFIHWDRENFA